MRGYGGWRVILFFPEKSTGGVGYGAYARRLLHSFEVFASQRGGREERRPGQPESYFPALHLHHQDGTPATRTESKNSVRAPVNSLATTACTTLSTDQPTNTPPPPSKRNKIYNYVTPLPRLQYHMRKFILKQREIHLVVMKRYVVTILDS